MLFPRVCNSPDFDNTDIDNIERGGGGGGGVKNISYGTLNKWKFGCVSTVFSKIVISMANCCSWSNFFFEVQDV